MQKVVEFLDPFWVPLAKVFPEPGTGPGLCELNCDRGDWIHCRSAINKKSRRAISVY